MLCCECAYWGGWSLLCDDTRAPLRRTLLALGGRDTVVLFACTLRDADRELGLVRALQAYAPEPRPVHLVYRQDRRPLPKPSGFVEHLLAQVPTFVPASAAQ